MRLRINTAAALIMATPRLPRFARRNLRESHPGRIDATFGPGSRGSWRWNERVHVPRANPHNGKSKAFNLPGGRMVITAPGQACYGHDLNNPSRLVTLSTTGVFTFLNQPDGGLVGIGTGRNPWRRIRPLV